VYSADGRIAFWINDVAAIIDPPLPVNELATLLWWACNVGRVGRDYLRGPVLITGLKPPECADVPTWMVSLWERHRDEFGGQRDWRAEQ
jgi:hypothetical protein